MSRSNEVIKEHYSCFRINILVLQNLRVLNKSTPSRTYHLVNFSYTECIVTDPYAETFGMFIRNYMLLILLFKIEANN